jgi:PAS domain S-box-containing protein
MDGPVSTPLANSLRLLAAVAAADTPDSAAALLAQAVGPGRWWILAVTGEATARVVAGTDAGTDVAWAASGGVPAGLTTTGEPVRLARVNTPAGTWGAVLAEGPSQDEVDAAAAALGAVIAGLERHHELADQVDRLEEAQAVAHMGSYDWDITTDTNRWSDELYRIYGHEPQSFNASYDRFMSMLHPDDRDVVRKVHEQAYATGEPYHTIERIIRPTGEERVLDTTGRVIRDHTGTPVRMAGVCMDITERWHAEREAERIAERQRQALQINDNVLQGLAVALYALDNADAASARHATASTLALARQLVHDLLASDGPTHLAPGALVRDHAAPSIAMADAPAAPGLPVGADSDDEVTTIRVVVIDDSEDLRLFLRLALDSHPAFEVVGEAGDGRAGVQCCDEVQPDLVLLDLSMPVMDGLEALPLIRSAVPDARVVVLSGFDAAALGNDVRTAGAHAFVEKGTPQRDLLARLQDVVAEARVRHS